MIIIGIDPDLTKNGVAVMKNGQYEKLLGMPFPNLIDLISDHSRDENVLFVVEDVNAHKPTFQRGKMSPRVRENISQKVGMVKGVGAKIVELLEFFECHFIMTKPLSGTAKQCKNKPELFNRLTGWKGRSNADTRDAAMLIFKYKDKVFNNVFETGYQNARRSTA